MDNNDNLRVDNSWLTIEVLYNVGKETKRMSLQNQTWAQVREFRNTIFNGGLMLPIIDVAPGIVSKTDRWFVVSPGNIIEVVITRQAKKSDEKK